MNIIRAQSGKFWDGLRQWRAVGGDYYQLIQDAYTDEEYDNFFSWCAFWGIRYVRVWAFNKTGPASNANGYFRYLSGGNLLFREASFVHADRMLNSARKYEIRVILVLADNWPINNNWGHKQEWAYWSNTIYGTSHDRYNNGDAFIFDSNIKTWFKQQIAAWVNRRNSISGILFKDDPAILSYELLNEGRFTTGTDTNGCTVNSYLFTTLKAWHLEMGTYLKSQDPNHMLGTGSQSQFVDYVANDYVHNCTAAYGQGYAQTHALSVFDYFDFHIYPHNDLPGTGIRPYGQSFGFPNTPTKAGFEAQIAEYVNVAKAAVKPVMCNEIGLVKLQVAPTVIPTYPRSDFVAYMHNLFFNQLGGDAMAWWSISAAAFDNNNYNFKLDGPHTGGNANGNLNDDDTTSLTIMKHTIPAYFNKYARRSSSYTNKYSR